ncbi:MAG: hypothetical protein WBB97_03995 [Dehalococcoidales bacterium]
MQLVVLQLISGMVEDVVRRVCGSIKQVWLETENGRKGEFYLSPVAVKERGSRTRIPED